MTNYKGETSLETRKQAEELLAELRRQAYAEGYEQGKFEANEQGKFDAKTGAEWADNVNPPTMDELMALGREVLTESPQQKRDRIIEQAKEDINRHKGSGTPYKNEYTYGRFRAVEQFIINSDKRTVVCLLKIPGIRGRLLSKGIAKCAPNDCFNVHIGKAIALRRALGLNVPDEYLNAPQPSEVRVGDVVSFRGYSVRVKPAHIRSRYRYTEGTCSVGSIVAKDGKIIDDSREEAK